MKPYVKVEGLPDLLLRYERDKEFNESGSDGNYCIFESFIEGIIFFHDCKSLDDDHLFLLDNHHES